VHIAAVPVWLRLWAAAHSAHLQVFEGDHVVLAQQVQRRLLVEVASLATHGLIRPGQQLHRLRAALASLLAATDPAVGFSELLLGSTLMAGIRHLLAIGGLEKDREPDINAGLASSER
jgi:hypothetical protein